MAKCYSGMIDKFIWGINVIDGFNPWDDVVRYTNGPDIINIPTITSEIIGDKIIVIDCFQILNEYKSRGYGTRVLQQFINDFNKKYSIVVNVRLTSNEDLFHASSNKYFEETTMFRIITFFQNNGFQLVPKKSDDIYSINLMFLPKADIKYDIDPNQVIIQTSSDMFMHLAFTEDRRMIKCSEFDSFKNKVSNQIISNVDSIYRDKDIADTIPGVMWHLYPGIRPGYKITSLNVNDGFNI